MCILNKYIKSTKKQAVKPVKLHVKFIQISSFLIYFTFVTSSQKRKF